MSSLVQHVENVGRRVPPAAVLAGVLVVVVAWWLAVQQRCAQESGNPAWLADAGPPEIVAAGPWANWAAARPPGIAGACSGRSVGATARAYAGDLIGFEGSIIGEC